MPTALVTGITGQDGSYLAEHLLDLGYRVIGVTRRTSTDTASRIEHLRERIELVGADLLDQTSLLTIAQRYQPDEVYNLAAQSFVPTSWEQPVLTGEFTALGVTRLLEALRLARPDARFYQASSSEMFGKVQAVPQDETTAFYPRSPYGVSKLYGHWITVNYRESYNMYATSGILFNHECLSASTPLLVRQHGAVNVVTPDELVPLQRKGRGQQTFDPSALETWDGVHWTRVRAITATRRRRTDPDHRLLLIQTRGGVAEVTSHHHMLDAEGGVLPARDVAPGDPLAMAEEFPQPPAWSAVSTEMAELLGLLTAEGSISPRGRIQFTNCDDAPCDRVAELWSRLFLGAAARRVGVSGWGSTRPIGQLYLSGAPTVGRWLREQLYAHNGAKRVPPLVLNAAPDAQAAYLDGYYAGDGLKAGNGESVKSNSAILAQGLCWLYANQGRRSSVYAERRGDRTYFQLNVSSAHAIGAKGQHLRKSPADVRRVDEGGTADDWVFDIETDTGHVCAGVGRLVVHNSPRRGLEFVTRKISYGVARIKHGVDRELRLGNLDARRDWGFAGDYVRAMHLMLQPDEPNDYVVATGETHSVQECCEAAFEAAGLNWQDHVVVDPAFYRPAEVDLLVGDPARARTELGWEPAIRFRELVAMMVDADLALVADELSRGILRRRAASGV